MLACVCQQRNLLRKHTERLSHFETWHERIHFLLPYFQLTYQLSYLLLISSRPNQNLRMLSGFLRLIHTGGEGVWVDYNVGSHPRVGKWHVNLRPQLAQNTFLSVAAAKFISNNRISIESKFDGCFVYLSWLVHALSCSAKKKVGEMAKKFTKDSYFINNGIFLARILFHVKGVCNLVVHAVKGVSSTQLGPWSARNANEFDIIT